MRNEQKEDWAFSFEVPVTPVLPLLLNKSQVFRSSNGRSDSKPFTEVANQGHWRSSWWMVKYYPIGDKYPNSGSHLTYRNKAGSKLIPPWAQASRYLH